MMGKFFRVLAFLFGLVGSLLGVAAIGALWIGHARVQSFNQQVDQAIDDTFAAFEDRVSGIGEQVAKAKSTSINLDEELKELLAESEIKKAVIRVRLQKQSQTISKTLVTTDQWLATAESSILLLQRVSESADTLGFDLERPDTGGLLDKIGTVRDKVSTLTDSLDAIQNESIELDVRKNLDAIVSLSAKLVATLTDVDQRLANLGQAIDSTREANRAFFMRMERSIFLACLAGTLLVIWLLAGQIALCLVGWRGLGKTTTAVA